MPKRTNRSEKMEFITSVGVAHTAPDTAFQRDLARVRFHLREIVTPEAAERWLDTPQSFLNNQTPRNMIRLGQLEKIMEAIAQIEYGIHV